MKRRTFLKTLGIITGTLATNPIKGLKALELQGVGPAFKSVQAGNTLLTPDLIAKEALKMLEDNLVLSEMIGKDDIAKMNKGHTVKIRKPVKFKL